MDFVVDIHAHGHVCLIFIYLKNQQPKRWTDLSLSFFFWGSPFGENIHLHLTKK